MKKNLQIPARLAAIDIGSNAARLLIKELSPDSEGEEELSKLLFLRFPLRLGTDVYSFGSVSKEKGERMVEMLLAFRHLMNAYGVDVYRACATSALRDAANRQSILKNAERKSGIRIELISGEEESSLIYDNRLNLSRLRGNNLFVDVGGGSTEVSLVVRGERTAYASYPIGAVRQMEGAVKKDDVKRMDAELSEWTRNAKNVTIIGSGGNINKIYRIVSRERKDDEILPVELLGKFYRKAVKMDVVERMRAFGIKADRADTIVPAAEIFLAVSKAVRAKKILVPSLGLADGIITELSLNFRQKSRR